MHHGTSKQHRISIWQAERKRELPENFEMLVQENMVQISTERSANGESWICLSQRDACNFLDGAQTLITWSSADKMWILSTAVQECEVFLIASGRRKGQLILRQDGYPHRNSGTYDL